MNGSALEENDLEEKDLEEIPLGVNALGKYGLRIDKMTRITLEQVAKMSGVSRSTVSRVVNQHQSVRPEVRQRVWEVIEDTGYQPNMAARTLASNRSGVIALVIPRVVASLFADPYFPFLIQGISQGCNANNLTLSLFLFHSEDEEQMIHRRVLRTGLIDGVIVASSLVDDPLIPKLIEQGAPVVVIGRPDKNSVASYVDAANIGGAKSAVSHLLRLGYKRVSTITGRLDMSPGVDRLQGYLDALKLWGISERSELIVEGDFSEAGGYSAMHLLLRSKPDAVFIASDTMALGALRAIEEVGLRVPNDIAIVGFDDLPPSRRTRPPLTVVRQPVQLTGQIAVDTLVDILEHGDSPPRRIVLDTQLIIRDSCGAKQKMGR
ncbi:MAG TPA: LacI family DNA-binding transcriptional regulator [candidate division Zixibacteria bacterium]|nr:LacI family DNA-binding transcriptional regulator [candidate division Zixibacteria bacterium]